MEPTDITVEILKSIRDEIRSTRTELKAELGGVKQEISTMREQFNRDLTAIHSELAHRIVQAEVRFTTAVTSLAGSVEELRLFIREQLELKPRVEKCEQEIAALKARLPDA